jgi:hypothetical protein
LTTRQPWTNTAGAKRGEAGTSSAIADIVADELNENFFFADGMKQVR